MKQKLIEFIKKWEGGYVNDPYDAGGHTNKGVTLATYRTYCGHDKTVEDLINITDEEWEKVFDAVCWNRWQADKIQNPKVAAMVCDWTWHSGVYGISIPQRMVGTTADGFVGYKTLTAINRKGTDAFAREIAIERMKYFDRICRTRPQNKKFLNGWRNRVNDLVELCGLSRIADREVLG